MTSLQGTGKREWLIPCGILLFSFFFRVVQVDIAFFGPEQAWIAQASWKLANLQQFPTHLYLSSANFSQFPLTTYITFIPYLFSDSVFALQTWYLLLNLLAVGMCWWFARRYWGLFVATMATVVYACMPWAVLLSLRVWPNTLLPPFVMMWAVACGFAFAEKRPRWLALAWAASWLALQLHASGILLLVCLFILMWVYRLPQGWRHAFGGSVLGVLPALPWVHAQLTDVADLGLNLATAAGRRGFQINFEQIAQFLTASDLAANFISEGRHTLASRLAPMTWLARIWLVLYIVAPLFLVWRTRKVEERQQPLYLLLVLWCAFSLGFTLLAKASHTIAYYLPLLPAPCIALALLWQHIRKKVPQIARFLTVGLLALCVLNLDALWVVHQHIDDGIRRGDPASHAFSLGDHPPPLIWQLEMTQHIRHFLDAGVASELILIFHVDKGESPVYMRWPFAHHLRGSSVRVLDTRQTHRLYPRQAALYLWNERESRLPESLKTELKFVRGVGPYHLFQGGVIAAPAPQTLLPDRPAYENGLRLIGYDDLLCEGSWMLHWTPGPADMEGPPVHFFVHLLDAQAEKLTQHDLRAYDVRDWREGDHIMTNFDFGKELQALPIKTVRVGLYHFSVEANTMAGGISALDEQGRPLKFAIDIPHEDGCIAG